jgi:hypothetical protein
MDTVFIVSYSYCYDVYENKYTSGNVCACRTEEAARAKVLELQESLPKLYERIGQAMEWLESPSADAAVASLKPDQDYHEWCKREVMSRFDISDSEMCRMYDSDWEMFRRTICYGYDGPLKLI